MNHTVAYEIDAALATHANDQIRESFLRKIVVWLNTILMSRRPIKSTKFQHKSFMDENLLDDVMGPEISRTLRR
jgi:hypothetical protein